jgi:HD-like signal output (HDOD) protein
MLVDDEHHALHSLKRTLLDTDPFLKITLLTNGREALEQLLTEYYDVLITDTMLPGLDGISLMERVQKLCPSTIRILVDGAVEETSMLRALNVAHQVVKRPLDSQILWALICQTVNLLPLVSDETIRQALGRLTHLPPAPKLYRELSQLLQQPLCSVDDVVKLVGRDPSLTAKLLHLANSAFFTRRAKTIELRQAVVRLGFVTIRNLMLGVELFEPGGVVANTIGRELEAVQQRAFHMAQMAERLARGTPLAGDAFVAGLLADIGQVVFLLSRGDEWRDCRADACLSERPLHELEREYFGVSHAEVGAYLLGIWGLPYSLVEAVANHHRPDRIMAPLYSSAAIVAISASIIESIPINDEWLTSMKAKTRVELVREQLATEQSS